MGRGLGGGEWAGKSSIPFSCCRLGDAGRWEPVGGGKGGYEKTRRVWAQRAGAFGNGSAAASLLLRPVYSPHPKPFSPEVPAATAAPGDAGGALLAAVGWVFPPPQRVSTWGCCLRSPPTSQRKSNFWVESPAPSPSPGPEGAPVPQGWHHLVPTLP